MDNCEEEDRRRIYNYVKEHSIPIEDPSKSEFGKSINEIVEQCSCYLGKVQKLIKDWETEKVIFVDLTGLKIRNDGSKKVDRVLLISKGKNKLLLGVECKNIQPFVSEKVIDDDIIDDIKGKLIDFYSSNLLKHISDQSYVTYRKIILIYLPLRGQYKSWSKRKIEKFVEEVYNILVSKLSQQEEIINNLKLVSGSCDGKGKWRNLEIMTYME